MGLFLNQNDAGLLQKKALIIQLIGFAIVFLEVYFSKQAVWLEKKIHEYAEGDTLTTMRCFFKGDSKVRIYMRFLVFSFIIGMLSLLFGGEAVGRLFLPIVVFGPFILVPSILVGGVIVITIIEEETIKAIVSDLMGYTLGLTIPSAYLYFVQDMKILEILLLAIVMTIISILFFLAIQFLSWTINSLKKLVPDDRALSALGLIISILGFI